MAVFIDDSTVGLKISGIVTELYPDLEKEQVKEVAHHVYHKINIMPVYEQATELIHEQVKKLNCQD